MRTRLCLFLMCGYSAWAANYTLNTNGGLWGQYTHWTNNATGLPSAVVPGPGDTVSIPDGMSVSTTDPVVIGQSGANGSIAVNLNNSGQLRIFGSFTTRGDVVYTPNACKNLSPAVVMQGGSSWQFDASAAAAPAATHYAFGPTAPYGCRPFVTVGTPSQRVSIGSNPAGGAGQFSERGFGTWNTQNGSFIFANTDFTNIGDAAKPGWQVGYDNANNSVQWNVTYSTFTHCGKISSSSGIGSLMGPGGGAVFQHSYNIHQNTASNEIFDGWYGQQGLTTGTRMVRNNVFDVPFSMSGFQTFGFTFWSNYFGDLAGTGGGGGAWASFQGNFYRMTGPSFATFGTGMNAGGDVSNSYVFYDSDGSNPHVIFNGNGGKLNQVIWGQAGNTLGGPTCSSCDSGELFWNSNTTVAARSSGIYNSIILPNMTGHSSLELGSLLVANKNVIAIAEHNTYFGGFGAVTAQGLNTGFGAIQMAEDAGWFPSHAFNQGNDVLDPSNHLQQVSVAGTTGGSPPKWNDAGGTTVDGTVKWTDLGSGPKVVSFRSNILWNPQLTTDSQGNSYNYQSSFFKVEDVSVSANPAVDICAPVNCDYNTGVGYQPTYTTQSQYKNQQKGYAASFSSPPGAHDVDKNPMFVDYQRAAELFDSKYLGRAPAAWQSSATYTAGQFVRWNRQNVYWALPVNYRYQNIGACGGTNPEPGAGPNWRDCWEWATLYDIRQARTAEALQNQGLCPAKSTWSTKSGVGQCLYDDQTIGAHGVEINQTLMAWVIAGYAPTNSVLAGAAHDGSDIGAVPVVFAPPPPSSTKPAPAGAPVRGGKVGKGKFR